MSIWNRQPVHVARASTSGIVCDRVEVANTFAGRLVGLLGRKELPVNTGLWLSPSSGVHTFGMRFPIDVVALDAHMQVVGLHRNLGAWKIAATKEKVCSVLELPAGQIDATRMTLGEIVRIEPRRERGEEAQA